METASFRVLLIGFIFKGSRRKYARSKSQFVSKPNQVRRLLSHLFIVTFVWLTGFAKVPRLVLPSGAFGPHYIQRGSQVYCRIVYTCFVLIRSRSHVLPMQAGISKTFQFYSSSGSSDTNSDGKCTRFIELCSIHSSNWTWCCNIRARLATYVRWDERYRWRNRLSH